MSISKKEKLLAVLIDADNISPQQCGAIFKKVASFGDATIRRIYGDFTKGQGKAWVACLAEYGIVPVQRFAHIKGKNASDISLVIDAMDILYSSRVDAFAIVSSDSDFTGLAIRVREQGIYVYGIGETKTPLSLRKGCDTFIELEKVGDTRIDIITEYTLENATVVIQNTLKALQSEDGWYSLSTLGKALNAAGFDRKQYVGGKTLTGLLQKTKMFDLNPKEKPTRMKKK